jgi:hypothetical protein
MLDPSTTSDSLRPVRFCWYRIILVGRNQYVELRSFSRIEEFPVLKLWVPLQIHDGVNLMLQEESAHTDRNVFVKQDAQRDDFWRRLKSP